MFLKEVRYCGDSLKYDESESWAIWATLNEIFYIPRANFELFLN